MPFPESERVLYRQNPLQQVICQLRFPTILQIDAAPPTTFQNAVRERLPEYAEVQSQSTGVPPQVARLIHERFGGSAGQIAYHFESADRRWLAGLTRDFLAFTDHSYETWEQFLAEFNGPLEALNEEFEPAYFSRVGLRYRDVIERAKLGLEQLDWGELLNPCIAGALADADIAEFVGETHSTVVVELRDYDSQVRIQHGLLSTDNNDKAFFIDADFWTESRTSTDEVFNRLNYFNRHAGRLFRWSISDALHEAMDPHPID